MNQTTSVEQDLTTTLQEQVAIMAALAQAEDHRRIRDTAIERLHYAHDLSAAQITRLLGERPGLSLSNVRAVLRIAAARRRVATPHL